jgi:hypothetical protein
MNLVDLVAILPYLVTIALDLLLGYDVASDDPDNTSSFNDILRPQMATFLRFWNNIS